MIRRARSTLSDVVLLNGHRLLAHPGSVQQSLHGRWGYGLPAASAMALAAAVLGKPKPRLPEQASAGTHRRERGFLRLTRCSASRRTLLRFGRRKPANLALSVIAPTIAWLALAFQQRLAAFGFGN